MKTGDKALVRLDGVVYEGTGKRAFLSPFGVPSETRLGQIGKHPPPRLSFHARYTGQTRRNTVRQCNLADGSASPPCLCVGNAI